MRDDSGLRWAEPGVHNGSETILSNGNAMISPVSPLSCSICARLVTWSLLFHAFREMGFSTFSVYFEDNFDLFR